jgi:RND family efflux transporter MFP subunit
MLIVNRCLPLAALAAAVLLSACSKTEVAAAPEVIRPVQSVLVGEANGGAGQSFPAQILPRVESRLGFRVGGKITARLVELGATVRKGQPLLRLDPVDLQLAAQASAAQVAAAKANDEVAQANLKRVQSLATQGFVSAGGVDAAQGQAKASAAALQAAQAASSASSNASQYAVLVADAAGVVTGLDAEVGQVVAAGTPVVRVSQSASKDVVFSVPESQLGAIRALRGKAIDVSIWSQPQLKLSATVRDIAAIADPAGRSYTVKAGLAMTGDNVPLGATGSVQLANTAINSVGVLSVPTAAVVESQGKTAVWVVDGGVAKKKIITVSTTTGDSVGVIGGLSRGEEIITAGTHTLVEGQKVKSMLARTPAAPAAVSAATMPAATKP